MQEIEFTISKADIYKEVANTTSYTGAKMDDPKAYARIFTTDEDLQQIERFWQETIAEMCQDLIRVLGSEENTPEGIRVVLNVSNSFDRALLPSMRMSLRSYFVQSISAKWFVFTNKGEASEYAANARTMLDDVKRKAFYKKMPKRPTY